MVVDPKVLVGKPVIKETAKVVNALGDEVMKV
jgi:hypothetical protein